ncbi:class I SAM-dependent methyltransferase [Pedobacter sp. SYP-B3415]|uniref:class I SAM-dependent methyltransferase n=1 Tax=Pedobacter sp. SYP-B3415 TaxID=2496641 RepID=UPI00101CFE1C|nr:class I SAM-dependent methyltransferase [Pedobacter sp. SYP-B3415]
MSTVIKQQTPSEWEHFWKTNPSGFDEIMLRSTAYFADKLEAEYPGKKTERLLDLGCGPGFLTGLLKDHYAYIHGTDISSAYVDACRLRFSDAQNVEFSLSAAYDFEYYIKVIERKQITRVVMLSVLQYYRSVEEVKGLLVALKAASETQKFVCLLADVIPTGHSMFSDIGSIVLQALKNGYALKFARFITYALFSDYRKTKKQGLLQIDPDFFKQAARDLNVKVTFVKGLSIHSGRYNVLLDFTK